MARWYWPHTHQTRDGATLRIQKGDFVEMKKRPYIMVVDDDQDMLRMLKHTLELEGYGVAVAADSRSALALLEERKPDLVILEITMPEVDAYQVFDLIRQRFNVPVIMLTTRNGVPSLDVEDYMRKPFRTQELLARIRAKLRRARP